MSVRYAQASAVLARRSFEGVVLLPTDGEEPLLLGGSGALVWELLTEAITFGELCEVLSEATAAPKAVVEADVEPLLRGLVDLRLVQEVR